MSDASSTSRQYNKDTVIDGRSSRDNNREWLSACLHTTKHEFRLTNWQTFGSLVRNFSTCRGPRWISRDIITVEGSSFNHRHGQDHAKQGLWLRGGLLAILARYGFSLEWVGCTGIMSSPERRSFGANKLSRVMDGELAGREKRHAPPINPRWREQHVDLHGNRMGSPIKRIRIPDKGVTEVDLGQEQQVETILRELSSRGSVAIEDAASTSPSSQRSEITTNKVRGEPRGSGVMLTGSSHLGCFVDPEQGPSPRYIRCCEI
jgi:hypothetical protein